MSDYEKLKREFNLSLLGKGGDSKQTEENTRAVADLNARFPVGVADGGTGAATAAGARMSLGLNLPLAVASGGTGAATAAAARTNLGLNLPIPVTSGGTGAATASAARTNLGINFPLSVASGGTGASTASAAVTALGIRDYIVETGTTGSWTYRKWNSGFAECWANLATTNTNGRYVGSYPFTLTATPFMFVQRRYNGTLNTIVIAQPQVASYNIYFRDGSGNVMTGTFEISVYIFGQWK